MNIWDWELLGDTDIENRMQNWIAKHRSKTFEIEGKKLNTREVQERHDEISRNPIFFTAATLQQFWLNAVWIIRTRLFHAHYQDLIYSL